MVDSFFYLTKKKNLIFSLIFFTLKFYFKLCVCGGGVCEGVVCAFDCRYPPNPEELPEELDPPGAEVTGGWEC